MNESRDNAVLVVGGGVAGAQVASELILSGVSVYLIEKAPSLGGITSHLGYMFPHHNCVLCRGTSDHGFGCTRPSISPEFLDFNQPDQLHVMTLSELIELQGSPGRFTRRCSRNLATWTLHSASIAISARTSARS